MSEQFSIKYRPRRLQDVYGQDAVVKELITRTKQRKWPNSILLKGKYGTGKTTIGQIIAQTVNCKNPDKDGNPCGVCPSCKSIISERYDRDTQLLDGSLIGTKDDMVEFVSNVDAPPLYDSKRVFIIEEADQLSKGAINALHKILEKPRDKVMFILLSMTQTGVPPSIVSRCQTYNLKDLSVSSIMYYLKNILEKENLWQDESIPREFKFQGLSLIASSSNGSLREAVQLLERAVIGKYFTLSELEENLNLINEEQQVKFVEDMLELKFFNVFKKIDEMDVNEFINLTSSVLSNAYALKLSGYIKNEYFENKNKAIANHRNFSALSETFYTIVSNAKPFIRKSEVMYLLSKYIERCSPAGLTTSSTSGLRVRGVS